MDTSEYVAERVARGVAAITARGRSLAEIDLDTLDLTSGQACVLGQLDSDDGYSPAAYYDVSLAWSREDGYDAPGGRFMWAVQRGFTTDNARQDDADTMAVQAEWHRVIAAAQGRPIPATLFPVDD